MGIFSKKEKSDNLINLERFESLFSDFLKVDKYIPYSEVTDFKQGWEEFFKNINMFVREGMIEEYCKKNVIKQEYLMKRVEEYNHMDRLFSKKNEIFVSTHLKLNKEYLDKILFDSDPNILLDINQREVVLTDDDHILVVAGAGSGKTTTIEAKVKYLVDKKGINPEEILIVSYTKEATNELKNRIISKLKINAQISTFHAIGNTLIAEENNKRHNIVDFGFLVWSLQNYFKEKIDDDVFIKKTLLFFSSYLDVPFDEEDTDLLFKKLRNDDYTTLKQDLQDKLKEYSEKRTKSKRTLNDERVSSVQEAQIANFLYINGIEYQYQSLYPYAIKGTIKPYLPDFYIKQGLNECFLEHFALSESGVNNRFSTIDQEKYKKHINDKVVLHREHGTKLIYTFSKYNDQKDLITHLDELLVKNGFILNRVNDKDIYKKILETVQDRYFFKFIQLIGNFINKIKVNNWNQTKIQELKILTKDERTKLFLDIAHECYLIYEQKLKEKNAIDFEDMINNASNILDSYINESKKLPFKYIFIDEYQDISLQRFNLAKKLAMASDAKIIAVGDDWQSIFKFAGGNISLFTEFEKNMGYSRLLKITNTYRNSQELIDIAGKFVQENELQIKKELNSHKSIKHPVIIISYNDSYDKNTDEKTPFIRMCEAIEEAIDSIVLKDGLDKEILLIGRFNIDGKNLEGSQLFEYKDGKVVSKKYPQVPITFTTAHSSKGLGFDNVIIINGKDAYMGFPSKIEDDPVMKLVIKNTEDIEYAEERRLFYVALTRTKNRVFIIVPQHAPSKFVLEIKDKFTNIILQGEDLNPKEEIKKKTCPYCGYPLQRRKNDRLGNELWLCSNEPEQCGFMTNNLKGGKLGICKCPECIDGYLVVKQIKGRDNFYMLGCNNYKPDGNGCNYFIMPNEFSYDIEQLKFNKDIFKEHFQYKNYDVYDIFSTIYKSVDKLNKEYPKAQFDIRMNALILRGFENKVIVSFDLKSFEFYGALKFIPTAKLIGVIEYLIENEVLELFKENNYDKLSLGKKNILDLDTQTVKEFVKNIVK